MTDTAPRMRMDLQFIPVDHHGNQYLMIQDHLNLVQEGKAIPFSLYKLMSLLDGSFTARDIQMMLMREGGGVLVDIEEVNAIFSQLDASFLLDSERFRKAREKVISEFSELNIRPCSHCGKAYPGEAAALTAKLDDIMAACPTAAQPEGKITAIIAPHIDLDVGQRVYASAYRMLEHISPTRVILLGVGHQSANRLFALTAKDFDTPLGVMGNDAEVSDQLKQGMEDVTAPDDFIHKTEHSIEFQVLFLQHLLVNKDMSILPILCGGMAGIGEYSREAYLKLAGPFLDRLRKLVGETDQNTLILAGVDFSHIGPKFGHEMPASHIESRAKGHDKALLEALSHLDVDRFWEVSASVDDQYNVCGFSALACLLEIIPPSKGLVLDYDMWHEAPTRSAVSFSAAVFTSQ